MLDLAPPRRTVALMTVALVANELVSYLGYTVRPIGIIVFSGILLAAAVLTWRRLEYGLILVFTELFIGGKGYLYSIHVGSATVSIRLALFILILVLWTMRYRLRVHVPPTMGTWTRRLLLLLMGFVAWGVLNGIIRGHGLGNVFFDANAYLFFGLLLVLLRPQLDRPYLLRMLYTSLAAVAIVLGVKSLFSLGIFAHWRIDHLVTYYRWIRNTGVGEIAYINGSSYRVFFQSQVYGLLAFFALAAFTVPNPMNARGQRWLFVPMTLGLTAVLVSLSRSFWLGGFVALIVGLVIGGFRLRWSLRQWVQTLGTFILMVALSYVLLSWALNFPRPFPPSRGSSTATLIGERFSHFGGEAAASSRLQLLAPLTRAIGVHPLFGSGFAQTVTYQSSDPRQTSAPSRGIFTTDAFEWGYLDIALKIGLVGLATYLALLVTVLLSLWRSDTVAGLGFFIALIGLMGVHLTTPYLNHPLGIGFVLIAVLMSTLHPSRS